MRQTFVSRPHGRVRLKMALSQHREMAVFHRTVGHGATVTQGFAAVGTQESLNEIEVASMPVWCAECDE